LWKVRKSLMTRYSSGIGGGNSVAVGVEVTNWKIWGVNGQALIKPNLLVLRKIS